jgi:hypothetical protein
MEVNKNKKDFFKNINKKEDYINLLNEYKKKEETSKSKISLRNVLNNNKKFKNVYNLINNDLNQNDNNNINTLLRNTNAINKLNDINYIKSLFHKNETKRTKGYIFLANKQNDNALLDVEYDKNNLLSINNNKNNVNEITSYSYRINTPYKNSNQTRINTSNTKNRSSRNFNNNEFLNNDNINNTIYNNNNYNNNYTLRRPGLYFINLKKENSKDLKKFSDFSNNFEIINEKDIKKWINKEKYIHNTDYNQIKKEELNSLFQQTQNYKNNENNLIKLNNNKKTNFEKDENVKEFRNEFENKLKNKDKKYLKANTNRISYENNPLYKNEILSLSNKLKTIDLFLKFKNKKKINKNNFYI